MRIVVGAALLSMLAACGGGGSPETPAPPVQPPPAATGVTKAEAFRFLNQATFGATEAEAQRVMSLGYEAWIDQQLLQTASLQLPFVDAAFRAAPPDTNFGQFQRDRLDVWFRNALGAPDQLRQRVAFALSEIMVVSQQSALQGFPFALADYYDMLARNAFGDFRALMEEVTLHPAMGLYLSMLGNQKPDVALNIRPDENFARENMQLFTVGLVELNPDGTVRRDAQNQPIPTYDQPVIEGFAHVYTGWTWSGAGTFAQARPSIVGQSRSMQAYAEQHDTGAKRVLAYPGATLTTIPARSPANPAADLRDALDNIFNHPNVGPFIAKQLIQRLVTSNPTPQYVERIARRFNDDGTGRRGNLGALLKAILLDADARAAPTAAASGKLKEPLLRVTQLWRAYRAAAPSGSYGRLAAGASAVTGQGPLQAPSVFNFFSPFYAPPGEISDQGLVAPEMQIATEYLNTQLTNFMFVQIFCLTQSPVTGCPARGNLGGPDAVLIDTTEEQALAADSEALAARIGEKLLGGQISGPLGAEARAMIERAPASLPSLRVAEAMFFIASSPEFAMQR
ncbi:MAG: DUF1800 domain-containing protein [Steroidobacteraceae bacterium]